MYLETTLPKSTDINSSTTKAVKLTAFDRWWAAILPARFKTIMPHWTISATGLSIAAVISKTELAVTMAALFWASIIFAFSFRKLEKLSPYIAKQKWLIPCYHALLFAFLARPVMAEVGDVSACNTNGLFGALGSFVTNVFAAVTFGAVGGATLSNLICQVIGFLTMAILLGFLGVLGYVSFQIGYQRQPVSTTLDPLFGFLIFAGGASLMIGIMIGTGEITGT